MKKKISSLLLAVVLVLGMSTIAFAANNVGSIESGVFITGIEYTSGDKYETGSIMGDIYGDFSPGDTINIFLDPSKFTGGEFTPETGMSARDLENAGVTFRTGGEGKNSNLIQNVAYKEKELNGKRVAMIQVQLVNQLVSTEEKDFSTTLTLYANKNRQQSILISGTISSPTKTVDASDNYVSIGKGDVVEAKANINNIEVDAGNNVSLFARMYQGKRYYAVASVQPSSFDIDLMNKYPEVEYAYKLDTTGFLGNDATVKINTNTTYYVYDGDGKYLGTTKDNLALTSKYYLANKEVNMQISGNQSSSTSSDSSTSSTPPPISGDIVSPGGGTSIGNQGNGTNGGQIPDTGIGAMPKIATFALLGGLATIGILKGTSRKKHN